MLYHHILDKIREPILQNNKNRETKNAIKPIFFIVDEGTFF
jgi:hypothetical protein